MKKRVTTKRKGKGKVEVVVSPRATRSRVRAVDESGAEAGSSSFVKRTRFDDDTIARFPMAHMLPGPHHGTEPGPH